MAVVTQRDSSRAAALLSVVHARPGITRAEAGRVLGLGTGATTELVARLSRQRLLAETAAPHSGRRGRPTSVLGPHPAGPVAIAVSITHESWTVAAVALGGSVIAERRARHDPAEGPATRRAVSAAVTGLRRRYPGRVLALGVAAPGVVRDTTLLVAATLGWYDIDLGALWRRAPVFVAGNDATLAAVAESARGSASDARTALHITVDAGVGGALTVEGRPLAGAKGPASGEGQAGIFVSRNRLIASGEFGHMPFGDRSVRCPCGAAGCWGTAVDGSALARLLGTRLPRDAVSYARRVIASAAPADRAAVRQVAGELGRGLAGLVNALDPDLVTLGGLGVDLLAAVPETLDETLRAGLMSYRRLDPPPVLAASCGPDGPLIGAGEEAWSRLLNDNALFSSGESR